MRNWKRSRAGSRKAQRTSGDTPMTRELRTPKIEPARVAAPITAIALSPDGKKSARATFAAVEIVGEESIQVDDGDLGKVNALSFSADGSRLLAASGLTGRYGRAAIYDAKSGKLLKELIGHRDILYAAEFHPTDKWLRPRDTTA